MTATALVPSRSISPIIQAVLDSVESRHTRRAYERALVDFFVWYEDVGRPRLDRSVVQRYVTRLREDRVPPSSINQRLSAIRKLAREAADNGALSEQLANGIIRVGGIRQRGKRVGNWLTRDEAQTLLHQPDTKTTRGLRDRAILAVLLGCGLRREEAAGLTVSHVQQRDGRWVIIDLIGKRNKARSVPMPSWTKAAIDAWLNASGIRSGHVFRAMSKGDKISGETMTAQAIRDAVVLYADRIGLEAAPHDLRRTYAKLAHKGGSGLDQIQLSLGHESIRTTQDYLGVEQNLTDAPCDHLGLQL